MLGRGVKRKLSDFGEVAGAKDSVPDVPYMQQRQLVLNMCLNKLQSCHMRSEPSLHRAVLLANTLRQIQEEMRREGWEPPAAPAPWPPHPSTPLHTPSLPPVPSDCPEGPGPAAHSDSGLALPPSLLREEGGAQGERGPPACPGCTETEEESDSSSSSSALSSSPEDSRTPDLLFSSFEITNSTSYLTDLAFDDIFEDIDTSMYDCSDFSSVLAYPLPRASGATPAAEDGLKSFPSCTTASALQLCLTDLNELDHIMEILVGS
ncbi:SERTA domain-containing protein 2 [Conger conger]|uniref:SERTA domain-containing protein 2 n=1 Tax=Conger conger TaxID=82655 RepID=UPI002A59B974|nr:SERTA domain-containing protein 2 [Conger conger]